MTVYNETDRDCEDCGSELGEEHDPKCNVTMDRERDALEGLAEQRSGKT